MYIWIKEILFCKAQFLNFGKKHKRKTFLFLWIIPSLMVNILIVDDHPAIVEGLKNLFDEPQYLHVVDTADSKEKLMNLLWRRKSVDLIILDIDLPDASGIEVAAILKEKHPQIKILIYSFFAKWKYIEDLERLGVDGYVTKGENMHILLEAIDLISNHGQTYFSKALLNKKIYSFFHAFGDVAVLRLYNGFVFNSI